MLVSQDLRGRYESEGTFHAFPNEAQDGHDTCAWICAQPWSNGRIGMFGASYVGLTQWQAALGSAPGLQAIVPNLTAADYHEGWSYHGGAFELSFNKSWTLTWLATDTARRLAAADPAYPGTNWRHSGTAATTWRRTSTSCRWPAIRCWRNWRRTTTSGWRIPITVRSGTSLRSTATTASSIWPFCTAGGWYDVFLGGTLHNFMGMRAGAKTEAARKAQRLLIGPWDHMTIATQTPVGEYDPGVRSWYGTIDFEGIHLRFYDRYLRDMDNGVEDEPPVRIFVMGDNRWRLENEWPLARTEFTDFFFHSEGGANTLNGDGVLSREEPSAAESVRITTSTTRSTRSPTSAATLCCNEAMTNGGQYDQRSIEARRDVLCYTTAPLEPPVEVTGPITRHAFCLVERCRHRFHRQTGRCLPVRLRQSTWRTASSGPGIATARARRS